MRAHSRSILFEFIQKYFAMHTRNEITKYNWKIKLKAKVSTCICETMYSYVWRKYGFVRYFLCTQPPRLSLYRIIYIYIQSSWYSYKNAHIQVHILRFAIIYTAVSFFLSVFWVHITFALIFTLAETLCKSLKVKVETG